VALTLGQFIELHAQPEPAFLHAEVDPAQHELVMKEVLQFLSATSGIDGRIAFNHLLHRIGLFATIEKASSVTDRGHLVRSVNVERLGNNPHLLDRATLGHILERSKLP
jgi:hypothetical protein